MAPEIDVSATGQPASVSRRQPPSRSTARNDAVHHVHRLDGILAGRGLRREHDRIRAIEYRTRNVGRLSARWRRCRDHAHQHLCGDNHRFAARAHCG